MYTIYLLIYILLADKSFTESYCADKQLTDMSCRDYIHDTLAINY